MKAINDHIQMLMPQQTTTGAIIHGYIDQSLVKMVERYHRYFGPPTQEDIDRQLRRTQLTCKTVKP